MPAEGRLVLAIIRTERVAYLPLVRLCKTWFRQGLLARILRYTLLASTSKLHVTCSITNTPHKHLHTNINTPHKHLHTHIKCTLFFLYRMFSWGFCGEMQKAKSMFEASQHVDAELHCFCFFADSMLQRCCEASPLVDAQIQCFRFNVSKSSNSTRSFFHFFTKSP